MRLRTATNQQLFDLMYKGLHKQGWKKSINLSGACQYRQGNLKCAVGHCISDAMAERWKSQGIFDIDDLRNLPYSRLEFLSKAQVMHDRATSTDGIQDRFHQLAKYYNLTIPEVK